MTPAAGAGHLPDRVGAVTMAVGNQHRDGGLERRPLQGGKQGGAERERVEMPELECARGEAQQQEAAAEDEADVGDQHHAATVEAVDERAGVPAQQDPGSGPEEGDERERRGVPGGPEHGDADRVTADLAPDQRHRLGDEEGVVDGEPQRRRQARNRSRGRCGARAGWPPTPIGFGHDKRLRLPKGVLSGGAPLAVTRQARGPEPSSVRQFGRQETFHGGGMLPFG